MSTVATKGQKTAKIEKMKQLADSKPKSIPRGIALANGDVKHYADADSNIAIARTGDTFLVYDYKTGNVTRDMTRAEVNAELARYRQSKSATSETTNATSEKTSENFSSDAEIEIKDEKISKTAFENEFSEEKSRPSVKEIKAANEAKEQAKRFDALAKEKIKDYDGLSEANKSMIRKIFREAEANGISEADALSYARVSARTGLDIVFDKKACYKGKNEAGADVYHAGFYDPENNRIVVNPETKKKHTVLLIHELSHAMRSYRKNGEVKYFIDEDAKVSEKMWKEIRKYYADENGNVDEALALDEASAYYAEAIFGTEGAIDLLLGEKPTLKQKLISFFTKSAAYYSTDEKLSKEARRHFRKFKAMFDAFTARNYGRNAEAGLAGDKKAKRFAMNANLESEIDNALKNKFYRNHVKLTENTPDILLSQKGVRNLPLYMKPSHVRENIFTEQEAISKGYKIGKGINYHGLGKPKFIEVISDLDNVSEAYRGTKNAENPQRREKYFLLISKIKDADGNTINVPIYINEYADYHSVVVETNKVATVFGKEGLRSYLQKEIQKGNLVRIKKKSLQVGDGTAPIAAAYGLKASDNSISDYQPKVNTSDKISSKKSSESGKRASMDADYMSAVNRGDMVTAQRMVDEAADRMMSDSILREGKAINKGEEADGTLIKMYHGSGAKGFYKFESNDGALGKGVYVTSNWDEAVGYALEKLGIEQNDNGYYEWNGEEYDGIGSIGEALENEGYVRGFYANVTDEKDISTSSVYWEDVIALVRDTTQLKSADPVTYDDEGNVIPLSERFNPKKSDIRYSMEEIDPAKMGEPTLPRTAGTMSVGQYKKRIADLTKAKSYSKDQIYDIVKKLPMADMAMEKTREQVAEAVWQIYNEQLTASEYCRRYIVREM